MAELPERGNPSSNAVETKTYNRISKNLTARRKVKVQEFLELCIANPQDYPDYQTDDWINALLLHMNEATLLPSHIKHWIEKQRVFQMFHWFQRRLAILGQNRNRRSPSVIEEGNSYVQVQTTAATSTTSAGPSAAATSESSAAATSETSAAEPSEIAATAPSETSGTITSGTSADTPAGTSATTTSGTSAARTCKTTSVIAYAGPFATTSGTYALTYDAEPSATTTSRKPTLTYYAPSAATTSGATSVIDNAGPSTAETSAGSTVGTYTKTSITGPDPNESSLSVPDQLLEIDIGHNCDNEIVVLDCHNLPLLCANCGVLFY